MAIKELVIRYKYAWDDITAPYIIVQQLIEAYLEELKQIDIEAFERECSSYNTFCECMLATKNEEELNHLLHTSLRKMGFELPWEGDFDEFMSNKNNRLVFS